MRTTETCRAFVVFFLLVLLSQQLHAATIFGTVTVPDGPVAGVKVAIHDGEEWTEFPVSEDGSYSIEWDDRPINIISALPPEGNEELFEEWVTDIDAS